MRQIEAHLIESFALLNEFFQSKHIRYCLIGGIAAGYWGEPRYTQDMDFTVVSRTRSLDDIIELFKKDGFKVRSNGKNQCQVFQKGKLKFMADLILAEVDYQDWVVDRAIDITVFDIKTKICTAEDLIILKLIANRRRDLLDIETVLKRMDRQLDKEYLKKWFEFWKLEERFIKEFGDEFKETLL